MDLTLTQEEYEALSTLALKAPNTEPLVVARFLAGIEKRNGLARYFVAVRWQDSGALPPNTRFPDTWPPNLELKIEQLGRPIARVDVDQALKNAGANSPTLIMVTSDRGLRLGWTRIEDFFR